MLRARQRQHASAPTRSRRAAWVPGAVALFCSIGMLLGGAGLAPAAVVATFDNKRYVDTQSGGSEAESDNVRASTKSVGHSVRKFTRIDADSLAAVLAEADAMLIPELETGDLTSALTDEARTVIADFVAAGGGLVINGTSGARAPDLLNDIFGFNLTTGVVGESSLAATAADTAFDQGPRDLPDHIRTRGLNKDGLPGDAVVIYESGIRTTVVRMSHGGGRIVYIGWDWFDARPRGRLDGGWLDVLRSAYDEVLECTDTSLGDVDGDGISDVCDTVEFCADLDGQRDLNIEPIVTLKKVGVDTRPDNDGLIVSGEFLLPLGDTFGDIDPLTDAVAVIVSASDGTELGAATLPRRAFEGEGTRGWRLRNAGRRWLYVDQTENPVNGIIRVVVRDRSALGARRVLVKFTGERGNYPAVAGDAPLQAAVFVGNPDRGRCAETSFNRSDCTFGRAGRRISCAR